MTVLTEERWRVAAAKRPPDLVTYGVLAVALVFFGVALATTDQDAMNGYGLISVLGVPFFVALVLVCYAAAREFSRVTLRDSHLAAVALTLIVVLFGIQNLSDSAAGFSTAWLHVGFATYIGDHGAILKSYDARFSWPGFFAGAASLTSLGGVRDAEPLLRWAPIFYNAAALLPLALLARHAGSRRHVAWLGVLLYYCANWYEQDYFSPQATNLVLYLITIAVLLWLAHSGNPGVDVPVLGRVRRWWHDGLGTSARRLVRVVLHDRPPRMPGLSAGQYVLLEVALVVILAASVVSHQLTPVAMIIALGAFSVTGRTRYKGLWIVACLAFVGWFSYGATDYWFGHLSQVIGDVGQVGSTVNSGVTERVASGDPAHLRVQELRLLVSAGYAFLAVVGLVVRRKSPWLPLLAALAFGPFVLLGLQSYGGEVVIRCFLFATPLLAILAAESLRFVFTRSPGRTAALVMVVLLGATFLQVATRGANQPFERITSDQIAAVRTIQRMSGTGTSIGYFNDFNPLPLIEPGTVQLTDLGDPSCADGRGEAACALQQRPDFVFASTSQAAYGTLVGGEPTDWLDTVTSRLAATGVYTAVIRTPHVTVLELTSDLGKRVAESGTP